MVGELVGRIAAPQRARLRRETILEDTVVGIGARSATIVEIGKIGERAGFHDRDQHALAGVSHGVGDIRL